MKRTAVIRFKRIKVFSVIGENSLLLAFFSLFILSFLCGCLLYSNNILTAQGNSLLNIVIKSKTDIGFAQILMSSFSVSFIFLFAQFLLGTSLTGIAIIPFITSVYGLLYGLTISALYAFGSFSAIVYNLLIIIPSSCFSVLSVISAGYISFTLSYSLGRMLLRDGQSLNSIHLKQHLIRFALLLSFSCVSALLEAIMCVCFKRYFEFG